VEDGDALAEAHRLGDVTRLGQLLRRAGSFERRLRVAASQLEVSDKRDDVNWPHTRQEVSPLGLYAIGT
jgi:hypothetical protein